MIKMNTKAILLYESQPNADDFTKKIRIQFNPTELTDVYSAEFKPATENPGTNLYYRHTSRSDLTLNLTLDGTEPPDQVGAQADVKDRLQELRGLILASAEKNNRKTPPRVRFVWGDFAFTGYVKSLTEKRTLFSSDGKLLRVDVTLVIHSFLEPEKSDKFTAKSNSRKFHTVLASDRLDLLAQQFFGDARLWRPIAEENSIERPALFPAAFVGQVLFIPDLSPRELARRQKRLRSV